MLNAKYFLRTHLLGSPRCKTFCALQDDLQNKRVYKISFDTKMATQNAEMQAQLNQFQALLNTLQGEVQDLRTRNNALNNDVVLLRQENQILTQNAATAANEVQAAQAAAQQAIDNAAAAQQQAAAATGGTATPVVFASTPAMVNHEDLINYQSKTGVMVYDEGRKALTTPFDMKSNGTVVYITELQAKCIKMG